MTMEPTTITGIPETTLESLERFAAQYAQLQKDVAAAGLEWRAVVAKANGTSKPKRATVEAGRYALTITMPDRTTVETVRHHPYAFCIAYREGGVWTAKYFSIKLAGVKSYFEKDLARLGSEQVALITVTVNGEAPAVQPAKAASPAKTANREVNSWSKLSARLAQMEADREAAEQPEAPPVRPAFEVEDLPEILSPEVTESLATANAIAAGLPDYTEDEITREPVEQEEEFQNWKIVGGTAVHLSDDDGETTLCGISERSLVQTDAEVTCKVCRKKAQRAA